MEGREGRAGRCQLGFPSLEESGPSPVFLLHPVTVFLSKHTWCKFNSIPVGCPGKN